MADKENNGQFRYSYSAREQEELKRIRAKYSLIENEKETKLERLRRLDASVTGAAQAVSLVFGVIGVLVFGFGMSLAISDLGTILGLQQLTAILLGSLSGVVGGILLALAYPVYNAILQRRRKKLAPEILSLTEELLK